MEVHIARELTMRVESLYEESGTSIAGCLFHDISGAGVQVGSFQYPLGAGADVNNTISDTIVTRAAAEFSGAAGIQVP